MTSPNSDKPLITASPTIHRAPPPKRSPFPPLTPQYIGLIGSVILDLVLGKIALALGGISVLGVRPFQFLTQWGNDRVQRANDAYARAITGVDVVAARPAGTTTEASLSEVYTAQQSINNQANLGVASAAAADGRVTSTNNAIYNGYFGTGGTGTATQVQATVEAIKTKLESGYTLETLTTTGTWTRPWTPGGVDEPTEFWALCFGSGGGGGAGGYRTNVGTVTGGPGGQGGSYAAIQIDPTTIGSTVSYTIATGAAGQAGSQSIPAGGGTATSGSQTSFGSFITTLSGRAFVSSLFGYYTADDSQPGSGGVGGGGPNTGLNVAPTAGTSTPLASGGAGGSNAVLGGAASTAGSTGGTASLTATTRAGGGGGGGGGAGVTGTGGSSAYRTASVGGNGGFPGGGAGGGGGMSNQFGDSTGFVSASGGTGGNGVIVLLWK